MRSVMIFVVLVVCLSACSSTGGVQNRDLQLNNEGAETLAVTLNISDKAGSLTGISDANILFRGSFAYLGDLTVEEDNGENASVSVQENTQGENYTGEEPLVWEAAVTDTLPSALDISLNASTFTGSLSSLQVSDLVLTADSSTASVDLPQATTPFPMTVSTNTGTLSLNFPNNTGAQLRSLSSNASDISVNVGSGTRFDADVEVNAGTVVFSIAPDVGVRVFADATVGNVSVPENFTQTGRNDSFVGDSTTYESPNYTDAATRITLRVSVTAGTLTISQP